MDKIINLYKISLFIGWLNVLVFSGFFIFLIDALVRINLDKDHEMDGPTRTGVIFMIVFAFTMTVFSGLLVAGIIKKRYKLMNSWLTVCSAALLFYCGYFVYTFFGELLSDMPVSSAFSNLFHGLLAILIAIVIVSPIYTVYLDMRLNIEQP